MRTQITEPLFDYITQRVTKTFARCWRIETPDAQIFGYTTHTRDIVFAGTTYESVLGLVTSALQSKEGLEPDNIVVGAFLSSQDESRIFGGFYDNSVFEVFLVNYLDLTMGKIILKNGTIGETTRWDGVFQAELRGLSQALQRKIGRLINPLCDARLGDVRCGKDISSSTFSTTGSIATIVNASTFTASVLSGYDSGWFSKGNVRFTSGDNDEIVRDIDYSSGTTIHLYNDPPFALIVGVTFAIEAGCTKDIATCESKFANIVNFRGFPQVPKNGEVFYSPIDSGKTKDTASTIITPLG